MSDVHLLTEHHSVIYMIKIGKKELLEVNNMNKNISIIVGHPNKNSFCGALAQKYINGAKESNANVRTIYIGDLSFNLVLPSGHNDLPDLEPDIIKAQEDIQWADHLVFVHPTWWYSAPAILKGFFERTFLPGFAYSHVLSETGKKTHSVKKHFSGKSAHIIATMDAPPFYYRWIIGSPGHKALKASLKMCGVKPVRTTSIGSIKTSSDKKRKKWLQMVEEKGRRIE